MCKLMIQIIVSSRCHSILKGHGEVVSFFVNCPFFQYNIKHLIFVCVNKLGVYAPVYIGTRVWRTAHMHTWKPEVTFGCCSSGAVWYGFLKQGLSLGPGAHREDGGEAKSRVLPVSAFPVKTTEKTSTDYTPTALPWWSHRKKTYHSPQTRVLLTIRWHASDIRTTLLRHALHTR